MSANKSAHADSRRTRNLEGEQRATDPNTDTEGMPGPESKTTQRLHLVDPTLPVSHAEPHADPNATQTIRRGSPDTTQPARHNKPAGVDGASRRPLRTWAARHKRALILTGVLIAIAALTLSGAAVRSAQGVQRAAVGGGGLQLRAASLAQADLRDRDLQWANLSQADMRQANLAGVDLLGADLTGADLEGANLEGATLRGADLSSAKLVEAVLAQANLHWTVMRGADLSQADLRGADLQGADLENATLEGANLEGANMKNAHLLGTTLPDGRTWTPSSNLRRFTDPSFPDFWRPGDPKSLVSR